MYTLTHQYHRLAAYTLQLLTLARTDKMLQNSLYIIASTGVMAVFGFGFWLIAARLYTPEQIGLGSTLISAATTLNMFALLGFDNVLLRFLPTAGQRDRVIHTSLFVAAVAAAVVAVIFLLALPVLSPALSPVLSTPLHWLAFIITMVVLAINTLTDSLFISFRRAKYILIADTGLSLTKIMLPLLLLSLGAFGIFGSFAGSIVAAAVLSLWFLRRRFGYRFRPELHRATLKQVGKYTTGTYLAGLIGAVPSMALPIMVTNALGAEPAGYFYLAMTVAALLFIVPRAIAGALFAEGASDEPALATHFLRALRQGAIILLPAVAGACLLGYWLLLVFGPQYATASLDLLRILAVSALLLGFNTITTTLLKVAHRLKALIAAELAGTITMLALALPLMHLAGLNGAGWAWLIGQAVMAAFMLPPMFKVIRSPATPEARA